MGPLLMMLSLICLGRLTWFVTLLEYRTIALLVLTVLPNKFRACPFKFYVNYVNILWELKYLRYSTMKGKILCEHPMGTVLKVQSNVLCI
jgi:hypothetical protein